MTHKAFSDKTCMECKKHGPILSVFGMFVCGNPKSDHYQHILTTSHHLCAYFVKIKEI